jgi:hypothetical protein
MRPRNACVLLSAFAVACSSAASDNQTHGLVVDSGADTVTDNPPDVTSPDTGADAGAPAKDGGHMPAHDAHVADVHHDRAPEAAADARGHDGASKGDASTCKGTIALAGGTSTAAFGATSVNGAAWKVETLDTTSASTNPPLVPFGGGFMAVFTASGVDTLQYSLYSGSSWSAGANADNSSCTGAPTAFGPPGLASIGTTLHSVYLGTGEAYDFYHGTYATGSWDCESDPVGGSPQSFGPSAPSAASTGSELVAVFDGMDGHLYAQSWAAGAWAAAVQIPGAAVVDIPPTIVTLQGGTSELLVAYEDTSSNTISFATRSSGTWGTAATTDAKAFTAASISVAALPAGAAVLAFLGTDGNPYSMVYTPSASTPWSKPVAIAAGPQMLSTPPTVAPGICGADAIAAIVQPAGVELFTLSSGSWSSKPTLVAGTSSVTFATIATSP